MPGVAEGYNLVPLLIYALSNIWTQYYLYLSWSTNDYLNAMTFYEITFLTAGNLISIRYSSKS